MLKNSFSNLRLDEYSATMLSSSCFVFLVYFLAIWNTFLYGVEYGSNLILYQIVSHMSQHHFLSNLSFPQCSWANFIYHVLCSYLEFLHFLLCSNDVSACLLFHQ